MPEHQIRSSRVLLPVACPAGDASHVPGHCHCDSHFCLSLSFMFLWTCVFATKTLWSRIIFVGNTEVPLPTRQSALTSNV